MKQPTEHIAPADASARGGTHVATPIDPWRPDRSCIKCGVDLSRRLHPAEVIPMGRKQQAPYDELPVPIEPESRRFAAHGWPRWSSPPWSRCLSGSLASFFWSTGHCCTADLAGPPEAAVCGADDHRYMQRLTERDVRRPATTSCRPNEEPRRGHRPLGRSPRPRRPWARGRSRRRDSSTTSPGSGR